jgi:hypothetical protein
MLAHTTSRMLPKVMGGPGGCLVFGSSRFEPAAHFIAGVVKHEKAVGRCVGVLASHLGKPRPAGFHELVQAPAEYAGRPSAENGFQKLGVKLPLLLRSAPYLPGPLLAFREIPIHELRVRPS